MPLLGSITKFSDFYMLTLVIINMEFKYYCHSKPE